jgi:hypothetical protein
LHRIGCFICIPWIWDYSVFFEGIGAVSEGWIVRLSTRKVPRDKQYHSPRLLLPGSRQMHSTPLSLRLFWVSPLDTQ